MNLKFIQDKAGQFLSENASTILTAAGVVGTTMTAVLTAKATFKAAEIIEMDRDVRRSELQEKIEENPEWDPTLVELTTFDKVKMVWPHYIPPAVIATATIGSIVAANLMSAKRAAALAAAYGISERQLKEYKDKVLEKVGPSKEQAIRDEIAQERVTGNPPREVLILAGNDVLCYDMITGRYFKSSMEEIKRAENTINNELFHHQYASLSHFYDEVGLAPTSYTDEVGWNMQTDGALEIQFTTTMSPDQKPCIAVDFNNPPHLEYTKLY